jgi:hypothetical protein
VFRAGLVQSINTLPSRVFYPGNYLTSNLYRILGPGQAAGVVVVPESGLD